MLIAVVTPLFPTPDRPYLGWPIFQTAEALRRFADVHVICPCPSGAAGAERLGKGGQAGRSTLPASTYFEFPVVPLLSRPWNGAVCARFLYPHLARLRPDLVLNYWLYPEGYAALRAGRSLGIPVIVSARGSDLRVKPGPLTLRRVARTVREADHVLTLSEDLRNRAIKLGAPAKRVTCIPNGTEFGTFYWRDQQAARNELGIAADERIILYVGRYCRTEGPIELVMAFSRLAAERRQLRLVCLGSGPLQDDMLNHAAVFGVKDRLDFIDTRTRQDVATWLNAADLACVPSYSEGCPNVILEAISCGCPVVASAVGGIPGLVKPQCGVLVPPLNVERLAQGLSDALSRTWDRPAISSRFARSWTDVARETFEVCRRIVRRFPYQE